MGRRTLGAAGRALLAAAALAAAAPASAGLGERADAIAEDRKALEAEPGGSIAHERYTVERMRSPANEVREYVSPSGVVFGVAWDGISHPDLDRLLGAYAPDWKRAAAKPSTGSKRHRRVRAGALVVETWGHMRSLHGRAWVGSLVPRGVSADAIR
ncbi:MAG TPA: DUF2844 domain-containing protein [Anaeromyxobacter sp.]|nr:DUF2844 domain-containing protein [Anaeromyxobacter sp.]